MPKSYNELFPLADDAFGFLKNIGKIENLKNQDLRVQEITENLDKRLNVIDSEHKGAPALTDEALDNLNEDPKLQKGMEELTNAQAELAKSLERQDAYNEAMQELSLMPDSPKAQQLLKTYATESQMDYTLKRQAQEIAMGKLTIKNTEMAYMNLIKQEGIQKLTGEIGNDELYSKWEPYFRFGVLLNAKQNAELAKDMTKLNKKYGHLPHYQNAIAALVGPLNYFQLPVESDKDDKSPFGNKDYWKTAGNVYNTINRIRRLGELYNGVNGMSLNPSQDAKNIIGAQATIAKYDNKPELLLEDEEARKVYKEARGILDTYWNPYFGTDGEFYKLQSELSAFVNAYKQDPNAYSSPTVTFNVEGIGAMDISDLLILDENTRRPVRNRIGQKSLMQQNRLQGIEFGQQQNAIPYLKSGTSGTPYKPGADMKKSYGQNWE